MKKAIIIGAIAVLLSGGIYLGVQIVRLKLTDFEYRKSLLKVFGFARIALTSQFLIRNTSDLNISITNQDYFVYVNDVNISHVISTKVIELKKHQYVTADIDIDFNPIILVKTALLNIGQFVQDPSKIIVTIKGTVSFSSFLMSRDKFSIDYKTTMKELLA